MIVFMLKTGQFIKTEYENTRRQPGISLVEVLLTLTLMAATILPLIVLISQNAQISRSTYIQSTRSLFQANASSQMDPLRSDYYTQFNDTTMTTSLSESGQTIPYMAKVDTTNSDTFKKKSYLYTYSSIDDAVNAPRTIHNIFQTASTFRLRCGRNDSLMDSSNQFWTGDGNAYDGSKKQPGYVTGSSGTTGSNVVDIVNTSSVDDGLFQYYREGTGSTNVDYKFDVPNGNYLISLYFAELNASVTGSAPNRRLMDIYIEGTLQNSSAYSPYETTGGSYRGNIQPFEVTVSDNVLNISIRRNASSNYDSRISGIVIQKRLIEG
jgi:Tfp pilus assembly protein PilV